jgi:hypothetical protein
MAHNMKKEQKAEDASFNKANSDKSAKNLIKNLAALTA